MNMKKSFFAFLLFFAAVNFNSAVSMDDNHMSGEQQQYFTKYYNAYQKDYSQRYTAELKMLTLSNPSISDTAKENSARARTDAKIKRDCEIKYKDKYGISPSESDVLSVIAQYKNRLQPAISISTYHGHHNPTSTSSKPKISTRSRIQSSGNIAYCRERLAPFCTLMTTIAQNANVHVLDTFVSANIQTLHDIGSAIAVDNQNLTDSEIKAYLASKSSSYKKYDNVLVTQEQLTADINTVLGTAARNPLVLGMYSRVVSLIQLLDNDRDIARHTLYLNLLFDAIVENRITGGGCAEGVRNRIFVRYVDMMNTLMG